MNVLELAAVITAVVALLTTIGKGVAWLVALVQDQADRTIAALKDENVALKEENVILKNRVISCERDHAT